MSRSGYSDDYEYGMLYGQAVYRAIHGKRGQALLRELRDAMDEMPEKALITGALQENGAYCALGVVGCKRGIPMEKIDPEEFSDVAKAFNIAEALAREIAYINDEEGDRCGYSQNAYRYETPQERWLRVRRWVDMQLTEAKP